MINKPKILFILHMPPPVHGAAMVGKYIHDSELINSKFECRYINLTMAGSLEDVGQISFYKVKLLAALLQKVRKEVKSFMPDLVYVTPNAKGGAFFKEFVIVQILKAMGCKVAAHYHNKGVRTKQGQWPYNQFYKCFFRDLNVILLGRSLYQDVEKYVELENVWICPNGIPERRCEEEGFRCDNSVLRLLFLSNLIESKGIIVLLDALKILKERECSFVCDFVGGETAEIDAKRFEEEVRKRSLTGVAIYQGKKYGEEKYKALKRADILVFPTYYDNECFPLVLLEAMSQKLPCVTTCEGAIGNIIEDGVNGLIAKRKDPQSLADKIELLLKDSALRKKMGQAGYEKYMKEFTLEVFERRMCEILKQLCLN